MIIFMNWRWHENAAVVTFESHKFESHKFESRMLSQMDDQLSGSLVSDVKHVEISKSEKWKSIVLCY